MLLTIFGILTTLYAFIGAVGFLIVDVIKSGDYGGQKDIMAATSPAFSEEMEQAKEIVDRVVEKR